MDDDNPKSPMSGKNVVSVFGVPLFATEAPDDAPDVLDPQPPKDSDKGSFLDSLNPFSSKKP
jgi:hypothetical protein